MSAPRFVALLFASRAIVPLVAVVLVLRAPGFVFDVLDIDEAHFHTIARVVALGGVPFVDAADIKPPLVYLVYLTAGLVGSTMWPVRILAVLWVLATAWVSKRAATRWSGREDVGWAAAWLSILAGLCELPTVSSELLMNLPLALALERAITRETGGPRSTLFWAGVFVAIGSLFRHQAGILLLAIGLSHFWSLLDARLRGERPSWSARLLDSTVAGLGFLVPWIGASVAFAAVGHFDAFFEWVIERNVSYVSAGGFDAGRALRSIGVTIVLGAPLPWLLASREGARSSSDPVRRLLVLALWLSWIPVSMGGRFYEHYFLQFVTPLAVLAAPAAMRLVDGWPTLTTARRALITALSVLPLVGNVAFAVGRGVAGSYPIQKADVREIGAWLKANTTPEEKVFMWGDYTQIYYLGERLPATRYVSAAPLMGNFDPLHLPPGFDVTKHRSERDVARALDDLERSCPAIVVDTAAGDIHGWSRIPLEKCPELERFVRDGYELVARPAGTHVYRRVVPCHRPAG